MIELNDDSSYEDDDKYEDDYETAERQNIQKNHTIVKKQQPKIRPTQTKARSSITFTLEDNKGVKK